MKILLDTHIILWILANPEKLPDKVINIIKDANNSVYYSLASVWEVAIKHAIKPDDMPISEEQFIKLCLESGMHELSISANHINKIKFLVREEGAPRHNDPFDRMLLAQAKTENMIFITHDSLIPYYNEACVMSV